MLVAASAVDGPDGVFQLKRVWRKGSHVAACTTGQHGLCTCLKGCERKGNDIKTIDSVKFEVLACEKVVYEGGLGLRALGTAHDALVPLRYHLALKTKSVVVPTPVKDSPKMPFGIRCAPRRDETAYKDVRNADTEVGSALALSAPPLSTR